MADIVVTGRVWKFGDNISTDLMMPGAQVLAGGGQGREPHLHQGLGTGRRHRGLHCLGHHRGDQAVKDRDPFDRTIFATCRSIKT